MGQSSAKQMGFLEGNLTIWIFLAMLTSIGLGYFLPASSGFLNSLSSGSTNIPIAIGLILMM